MFSRRFSTLPLIGIVTIVYFVAGKLGLKLAFLNASASAVWPPSGIALAALLLLGFRIWPAIFLGAFLVNFTTAGNFPTSLGIATGNTFEALGGAWLVYRFAGGARVFDRAQGVFKFALAATLSTLISPTIGLTSLALAGFADWNNYSAIWVTWWLGDLAGDLVLAPLIILLFVAPNRRWNRADALEARLLGLLLVTLGEDCFWRMVSNLEQELPHRVHLRTNHYLDGFPFHTTRDRHRHFCPRGHCPLGNVARPRAVHHGGR